MSQSLLVCVAPVREGAGGILLIDASDCTASERLSSQFDIHQAHELLAAMHIPFERATLRGTARV